MVSVDLKYYMEKIDCLICELEKWCEFSDANCLMQRLLDAKASFLEVFPNEDL